jgi:uncharacterized protein YjiS (DUF1127 family)
VYAILARQPGVGSGVPGQLRRISRRAAAAIRYWGERERQRRAFARLDDRLLADIGIRRERQIRELQRWS